MAYRLKAKESVPKGIKRVVHEELANALDQLSGKADTSRGGAIHEARKSVKKVRAVLRLVQTELGRQYRSENTHLRNVGRKLTEFRDAEALVEIFDSLMESQAKQSRGPSLDSIRQGLVRRKDQVLRSGKITEVLPEISDTLRSMDERVDGWPLRKKGFAALAPGFEKAFRRGQTALSTARKRDDPACYHAWRKRVKDHWYHVRLLENLWPVMMQARAKSLKDLETWLGDDHNLVLLRQELVAQPDAYGKKRQTDLLLTLIANQQKELRTNALALGERIYREKPGQLTARMKRLWTAWKNEPKSLRRLLKAEAEAGGKKPAPTGGPHTVAA